VNKETNKTTYQPAGKSDEVILPKKRANKVSSGTAESVEGRISTKRNTSELDRGQTQCWNDTMFRLARVREVAKRKDTQPFAALFHHITPELLRESFYKLSRKAAVGVDGMSWSKYQVNLDNHIVDLHARLQSRRYRPKPARRVYIAKEDGSKRPLSIQSLEDKIAQQAMVTLLNEIYEVDFLGFSYGFRPNRGQHDALDALAYGITNRDVNWVLDLDIEKFFDTVEHDWLIRMVQQRVTDKRIVELIRRWIKVGNINDEGKRIPARCGIPQGSVISPLLANIYLHYAFDLWTNQWRRYARGEVIVIRYADDAVLGFKHYGEASQYRYALNQRMAKFGLRINPKKTRLLRFGRFANERCAERGIRKPETFDFLGFTHFCTFSHSGKFKVGRRTSRKRLYKQIKAVQVELRRRLHAPIKETLQWLKLALQGHLNYYGVPGNVRLLHLYKVELIKRFFKLLRRRSQRCKLTWKSFGYKLFSVLPDNYVRHPYPEQRFHAKYSR